MCKIDHAAPDAIPSALCRACHPELAPTEGERRAFVERQQTERVALHLRQAILRVRSKMAGMARDGEPDPAVVPLKAKIYASLVRKVARLETELEALSHPAKGGNPMPKSAVTNPAPGEGAQSEESGTMRKNRKSAAKSRSAVKGKTAAKGAKQHDPAKGSKLAMIAALLKREKGCTTAEVLKATGWPAVSMPQQARMLGLDLKTEKGPFGPEGRTVTRYRAA